MSFGAHDDRRLGAHTMAVVVRESSFAIPQLLRVYQPSLVITIASHVSVQFWNFVWLVHTVINILYNLYAAQKPGAQTEQEGQEDGTTPHSGCRQETFNTAWQAPRSAQLFGRRSKAL